MDLYFPRYNLAHGLNQTLYNMDSREYWHIFSVQGNEYKFSTVCSKRYAMKCSVRYSF